MSTKITLELTPDEAFWLMLFCGSAASMWHQNWQEVADGKRTDLDADACKTLNRRAHAFADRIRELMPEI